MDQSEINDQMLIAAIRRRLLEEIQGGGGGSDAAQIINNVYGSSPIGSNGITEGLAASGGGGDMGGAQDDYDYFVDINRRDAYDPDDPERRVGWDKTVRRYREPQKKSL